MARVPPLVVLPPVIFAALAGLFLGGMFREDPDLLPSVQETLPAPEITRLPVGDLPSFDRTDLIGGGPKVVNFWASWCAPCRVEHPYLLKLSESVPVYGVNRDNTPEQAKGFLDDLGNPFTAVVADPRNRQSIDWGVYALPETFVVDGAGKVVLHVRGPINEPIYKSRILPAIEAASAE